MSDDFEGEAMDQDLTDELPYTLSMEDSPLDSTGFDQDDEVSFTHSTPFNTNI